MSSKTILINLLILLVGLIFIEAIWYFNFKDDIRFSVNVLAGTELRADVSTLYDTDKRVIYYSRDRYGFRGQYDKVEDIDIIAVGGSTTDQRYINNQDEWVRVLQRTLNTKGLDTIVVNAGVDGQSTYGHIKNFEHWFSKIDGLHPKYILYYVGNNDFYMDAGHSFDDLSLEDSVIKRMRNGSFTYYVYRLVKGMVLAKKHGIGHKAIDFESIPTTTMPLLAAEEYESLMKGRLDAYAERLDALISKSHEAGATPILITQRNISHWFENGQLTGFTREFEYEGKTANSVDRHYMEGLLNQTTMAACARHGNTICIDLAGELEFDHKDFYDFAHNTPKGTKKVGEYLAGKLAPLLRQP